MKKYFFCSLSLVLLIFCISCKKYSSSAPASTTSNNPTGNITSGTWSITSFTQKTEDKTSTFAGINFVFSSDGKLIASGTNAANGTWVFTEASTGYYGNAKETFSINLGINAPFNKLSKTWNIAEQNSTTLRLDNPQALEDEHVSFSKK